MSFQPRETAAMNSTTATRSDRNAQALPAGTPAAARTALRLLQRLQHGHLTVQLPDGTLQHFGHGDGPSAAITAQERALRAGSASPDEIAEIRSLLDQHRGGRR